MKTTIETKVAKINEIKNQIKAVENEQLKARNNRDYQRCEESLDKLHIDLKIAAEDLISSINIHFEIKTLLY